VKHAKRALIRHLYFVWQVPVDQIAAELRLRPRTVRRALVLRGGGRAPRSFAPPPQQPQPTTPIQEDPS